MIKHVLGLLCAILCLGFVYPVSDTEPAATIEFFLETTQWASHVKPIGNTANDGVVCFYDFQAPGNPTLKTRFVNDAGSLVGNNVIDTGLKLGSSTPFVAAWSPQTNSYLVVFRKGNNLYGRQINQTGVPSAPVKLITAYTADYMALTWTSKKRFVLFLQRGGQISAQLLRKNGKKLGDEYTLTTYKTGEAYPLAADTEDDGMAVCFLGHYRAGSVQYRAVKTNHSMGLLGSFNIGPSMAATSITFIRYFHAAYDPGSQRHACVWRVAPAHSQYTVVSADGSVVFAPANTHSDATPRGLAYDPVSERFSMLLGKLNYFGGSEHSEFYHFTFNPNGTVAIPEQLLKQTTAEYDAVGSGFSRNGKIILMWVNDVLPYGVLGRQIY